MCSKQLALLVDGIERYLGQDREWPPSVRVFDITDHCVDIECLGQHKWRGRFFDARLTVAMWTDEYNALVPDLTARDLLTRYVKHYRENQV